VGHKETRSEEEYVLDKKQAYVRIYTENPAISFVSEKGNRFICDTGVNLTRLLSDETIIKKCYEADESLDYLRLYYCEKNIKYQKHTMDSVESVKNMLSMDIINRSYYKKLMGIVIDYYYDNYELKFAGYPTDESDFCLTNIEFETDKYNLLGITIGNTKQHIIKALSSFGFEKMPEKCCRDYLCFCNLDVRIGVTLKDDVVSRVVISVATYYLGNRMY
jgi:hypothetical protein